MLNDIDRENLEGHVTEILKGLGLDHEGEHYQETPRRVIAYLEEFTRREDPAYALDTQFETTAEDMIVQVNIPFKMLCAHHLLPAYGFASVGYIPKGHIVGLSKLCRVVETAGTKAPGTQELITYEIAQAIDDALSPLGCAVVIEAEHTCLAVRGAKTPGVKTRTSSLRGVMLHKPEVRMEFLELCKQNSRL